MTLSVAVAHSSSGLEFLEAHDILTPTESSIAGQLFG